MLTQKIPNPKLLTHPNIPKPLHGLNPRTLLGTAWWDAQRRKAYSKFNYHCWACGVHVSAAKYVNSYLEAHECYVYDFKHGIAHLEEIVALCHSCHNFIHSGRLSHLVVSGEITKDMAIDILQHGLAILDKAALQPFSGTYISYLQLCGVTLESAVTAAKEKCYTIPDCDAAWEDWRLEVYGKLYAPIFKSQAEWEQHYGR